MAHTITNERYVSMLEHVFHDEQNSDIWFNTAGRALGLTDPEDFIFSKKIHLLCSIKSELSVAG